MSHFRKKNAESQSSAQEMVSKRLVDYFLVYSCEPQKRKQEESQETKNGQIAEEKKVDPFAVRASTDKSPSRKSTSDAGKGGNVSNARTPERTSDGKDLSSNRHSVQRSPIANKRASTRAVHLSVVSDGGIIGKAGNSREDDFLDEVTPLVTNRKGLIGGDSYSNSSQGLGIKPSLSDEVSIASNFRSSRIPATEDDSDDIGLIGEFNAKTSICNGGETRQHTLDSEGMGTPQKKQLRRKLHEKDEGDDDINFLTPSRMRALDSDEEDEDQDAEVETLRLDKSADVEESQNIHIPIPGGDEDATDPLAAQFTLLPVKTAQYPPNDHPECPMNPMVSHFCFPQTLSLTTEYQMPRIHYFVLTNDKGKKMYGTCLTFWEEYQIDDKGSGLNRDIAACLTSKEKVSDSSDDQNVEIFLTSQKKPIYIPKVLCLMSSWPYLHSFREYLGQLYRLATMTNLMNAPIERYVLNICEEAPAPPPGMFELQIKVRKCLVKQYTQSNFTSTAIDFLLDLSVRSYRRRLNSGRHREDNQLHMWPYHSKYYLSALT